MKKRDEGYVLAFVLIVIVVICLVAVSMMNVSLRNVQAQKASIERMEEKYRAQGKLEQAVANLEQLILNTNWTEVFDGRYDNPVVPRSEGEPSDETEDSPKATALKNYLRSKDVEVPDDGVKAYRKENNTAIELIAELSLDIEPTADAPYRVDTEITLTVTVKQVTDDPLKFELKKSEIEYTSYSISAVDPETIPTPTPTPTPAPAAQEVNG